MSSWTSITNFCYWHQYKWNQLAGCTFGLIFSCLIIYCWCRACQKFQWRRDCFHQQSLISPMLKKNMVNNVVVSSHKSIKHFLLRHFKFSDEFSLREMWFPSQSENVFHYHFTCYNFEHCSNFSVCQRNPSSKFGEISPTIPTAFFSPTRWTRSYSFRVAFEHRIVGVLPSK
jgi:hypothetical protein